MHQRVCVRKRVRMVRICVRVYTALEVSLERGASRGDGRARCSIGVRACLACSVRVCTVKSRTLYGREVVRKLYNFAMMRMHHMHDPSHGTFLLSLVSSFRRVGRSRRRMDSVRELLSFAHGLYLLRRF